MMENNEYCFINGVNNFHQTYVPALEYYDQPPANDADFVNDENEDYFKNIPPGYRFKPTYHELIRFYLIPKIKNEPLPPNQIKESNIYNYNPEELAVVDDFEPIDDQCWYFFSPRNKKYVGGSRPSRSAGDGFWKASGAVQHIVYDNKVIGFRTSLAFYKGKQDSGKKTPWLMQEFTAAADDSLPPVQQDATGMKLDYVLCKIYYNKRKRQAAREAGAYTNEAGEGVNHSTYEVGEPSQALVPVVSYRSPEIPNDTSAMVCYPQSDYVMQGIPTITTEANEGQSYAPMLQSDDGIQGSFIEQNWAECHSGGGWLMTMMAQDVNVSRNNSFDYQDPSMYCPQGFI